MSPSSLLNLTPDLMRQRAHHDSPGAPAVHEDDGIDAVALTLALTLLVTLLVIAVR